MQVAFPEWVASFLIKRLGELINGSANTAGNMVSNHGARRRGGTNPLTQTNEKNIIFSFKSQQCMVLK